MPKRLLQLCSYHSWSTEFFKRIFSTSSIIQSPRITNSANNYPRKLPKETLLKKSKLTLSSTTTSMTTQTSTIILSETNSIFYYCYHSLVLQVSIYRY
ncbi:unnamed protein product [Rotaria sp. Silwood2]|nr:unnamed protein product [Rotaria sp. Silwood2]